MSQATSIVMHWNDIGTPVLDAISGTSVGTATPKQKTFKGFFHEIGATSTIRIHTELQVGDAVIDLPSDVDVDGKSDVWFEVSGRAWVQKDVGGKLSQSWDVVYQDIRFARTLAVRRK